MFTIMSGNEVIYNPALFDERYQVINPELQLEVNKAGSLTFTMPPCNAMWGSLNKLTSIVTVEQDGVEIFRGRVMNDETDTWKQRSVYVEGELAFLLDSIQRPYEFSGNAVDLFRQLITNHNESVNEEKRFAIGRITAVDETTEAAIDASGHNDTFTEINDRLLNAYGGYIRIRHENGTSYIDYLSKAGDDNTQPIQLGVNLLDLKESINAEDVFTVLIPTGAMQNGADGKFSDLLKISEANNGLDYLEDAEGIAKYGRIWKRKHWDNITDPERLKQTGQKYLETGIAEDATLTITAVDMHIVDPEKQRIGIGDMVQIISDPHGLDRVTICYKIVMPLQEPERTVYTFGEPKRTLTDNFVRVEEATGGGGGGGGRTTEEEVQDILRWAYAKADQDEAKYDILTGELNNVTGELSEANIRLDGVEATIKLKADQTIVTEQGQRLSEAEVAIDGANAAIALKAEKATVDELGNRVTQAEASIKVNADGIESKVSKDGIISAINQTAEGVRISASKIELDGEAIVGVLSGAYLDVYSLNATEVTLGLADITSLTADAINCPEGHFDALYIGDEAAATQSWVNGRYSTMQTWVNANFATHTWATTNFPLKSDLEAYATQEWVEDKGYITSSALDGYATEAWVGEQGYLTSSALDGYATQSWANSNFYSRTYCDANFATHTWTTNNFALKSDLNSYQLKSGLTTKTVKVCTGTNTTKATTPPFYNANGTQVSSGVSYVSNVTYNTTEITYVAFA